MDKDEIPDLINNFIYEEEGASLTDLYLMLAFELAKLLNASILVLEKRSTLSITVLTTMDELRGRIENLIDLRCYGVKIKFIINYNKLKII